MTAHGAPATNPTRTSWVPMICLFLAQVLMSFNVAALPISLGGMVDMFRMIIMCSSGRTDQGCAR